eukprot:14032870-Alexandrium_andersonii.AAC.1
MESLQAELVNIRVQVKSLDNRVTFLEARSAEARPERSGGACNPVGPPPGPSWSAVAGAGRR